MIAPELVAPENNIKSPVFSSLAILDRETVCTSGGGKIPSLV